MREKGSALVLGVILLVGTMLRVVGSFGDYWLDEIVSILAVRSLSSPIEIFTTLFTDNNHLLNSLQIYLFHSLGADSFYRVLPTLASVAVLIMVWDLLSSRPIAEQVLGLSFFSFSYVLILFGTEARGYSFLVFTSIALFSLFESTRGRLGVFQKLFFWFVSVLGILSHYTFLQFYFALICFHVWLVIRRRTSFWSIFNHAVPLTVFAGLYFLHMQHLPEGSGPLRSHIEVIINTISISFGGIELGSHILPQYGLCIFLFSAVMGLILLGGVVSQLRRGSDDWVFYLMVIFVAPTIGIWYFEPRVIFVRYFTLSIVFSYLLLAKVVMRLQKRVAGVFLGLAIFGFFLAGNIYNHTFLLFFQRGKYQAALHSIHQESKEQALPQTVSSDHDFRNRTLIDYFLQEANPSLELKYVPSEEQGEVAQWYFMHELSQSRTAQKDIKVSGVSYALEKVYLHAPLSGWSWFVYKRKLNEAIDRVEQVVGSDQEETPEELLQQ